MPRLAHPVLAVLVAVGLAAALGLGFLSHAPNRLVSGSAIHLVDLPRLPALFLLLPTAVLVAGTFRPRWHAVVALASGALLLGLVWLAGFEAARLAAAGTPLSRTSLGAAFWVMSAANLLALADALQRLPLPPLLRGLAGLAGALCFAGLLAAGALDQLSLLKEYGNRQDVFHAALWQHLQIVMATLLPAVLIGLPLGVAAARSPRLGRPLFAVLNLVQTVPSIALFALLIAPLAWVATTFPRLADWGVGGIGLAPAVLALLLYCLLPVVRGTEAGLRQVPAAVIESARGMGLTPGQVFWQVELPLALPVVLAGLRVCTVQTVGLAVVAALIGAGGLGTIVFQGLLSSAADLVLLGVLPVLALAVLLDTLFRLFTRLSQAVPA